MWGHSNMTKGAKDPPRGTVLKGLLFPRLRCVYVSHERGELGIDGIAPLLQPQLEELSCCARHIADPAVRERLVAQCQQLRVLYHNDLRCRLDVRGRLEIGHLSTNLPIEAPTATMANDDDCSRLSELLEKLPVLRTLFAHSSYGACGADAHVSLASSAHLEELIDVFLNTATLRRVLQRVAQPFSALRILSGGVASDAFGLLVEAAPLAETLMLSIRGPRTGGGSYISFTTLPEAALLPLPALGELGRLGRLRELRLAYPRGMALTRSHLAALQHLPPQLRSLELDGAGGRMLFVRDFCDTDFAALVGRLRRLKQLIFHVRAAPGRLTAAAFRIAGEACRELARLSLVCKPFLWALEGARETPLFPLLGGITSYDPSGDKVAYYWDASDWQ